MNPAFKLSHKALLLVLVPLAFEITFVVTLVIMLEHAQEQSRREQLFILSLNTVFSKCIAASGALADYSVTDDPKFLDRYRRIVAPVPAALSTLRKLVLSNETGSRRDRDHSLETIEGLEECLKVIESELGERVEGGGGDNPVRLMGQLRYLRMTMRHLRPASEKFIAGFAENRGSGLEAQARTNRRIKMMIVAGVAGNIVLAIFLALYFGRSTVRRLDVLMDNTHRLAEGRPLNPAIAGSDEIAHLDHVFKRMADALVAAARKERAIIENAADVICSIDSTGYFIAVSPASQDVWGIQAEELVGKHFTEIIAPADRERSGQFIAEAAASTGRRNLETVTTHRDGRIVHVLWSTQWSESENALFCVAHDISARKELERVKQDFVAMVSHDLRTPLTSIQTFLSLLAEGAYGDLGDSGMRGAALADRNTTRLMKLITDLLDIERMESGQIPLRRSPTSVDSIIRGSLSSVQSFADFSKVGLTVEPSDYDVFADGDRIEQVLVNLLGNAVKFSPQGSTVTIAVTEESGWVKVMVKDQGRGIPEQARPFIFDRFKQVADADATEKKGSGLGLAISKAIVEQHGGKIGVESREGVGSTFWFTLPRDDDTVGAGLRSPLAAGA